MKRDDSITYEQLAHDILSAAGEPVAVEDLVEAILAQKTITAKNPKTTVKKKLRELAGLALVYTDKDHVLAISEACRGARCRIRLNRELVEQGSIPGHYFKDLIPRFLPIETIRLVDKSGALLPLEIKMNQNLDKNLSFESLVIDFKQVVLKEWFRQQKMAANDHVLVTLMDWEQNIFCLEREAFGSQKPEEIKERNQQVADIFYQMLEQSRNEEVYLHIAIPTLYARLPDKAGYPPDHWNYIFDQDERMKCDGLSIRYRSSLSPLERIFPDAFTSSKPGAKPNKAARQQVYRFRAAFKHQPSIWRDIEIQGKQTFSDLDEELRGSFNHDFSDHLSGFWLLIARRGAGKKNLYHEIDLGEINPFEEGEAAGITIAELNLQVDDRLKYVYDFGDWIEHTLILRNIGEPQPEVEYPREVERNQPKYVDCVSCKAAGKQTNAIWICHTCSEEQEEDILLCETCLEQHEDHYIDEIVY